MSLPACQERILSAIEKTLRAGEPRLASRFAIFTRLASGEDLPRTETAHAAALAAACAGQRRAGVPLVLSPGPAARHRRCAGPGPTRHQVAGGGGPPGSAAHDGVRHGRQRPRRHPRLRAGAPPPGRHPDPVGNVRCQQDGCRGLPQHGTPGHGQNVPFMIARRAADLGLPGGGIPGYGMTGGSGKGIAADCVPARAGRRADLPCAGLPAGGSGGGRSPGRRTGSAAA